MAIFIVQHQDIAVEWFKTAGFKDIHTYTVHSSYEMKDREYGAFCDDKSSALKLLFCVNMLNEGLHLEDISGVLMLRPTNSNIIWHQQIGRCIESNNSSNPIIIDAVNNFSSVGQGVQLLKDIKDAVRKEKEGSKDFDGSDFLDIDTFFVTEYVLDVEQMFKEIEGRLTDNWDVYIKALKQYKAREGDCMVPCTREKHVEILSDGTKVFLGVWTIGIRMSKIGKGSYLLTDKRVNQLNELGFIWDTEKYKFQKRVNKIIDFYNERNRLPMQINDNEKKDAVFISRYRNKNNIPKWKKDILNQIPNFFNIKINQFDNFYNHVVMYKKQYGHLDIVQSDILSDGYKIGKNFHNIKTDYRNGKLTDEQLNKLNDIGVDINVKKTEKRFKENFELCKQALAEGVTLSNSNKSYRGKNLYLWIKNHKYKFTLDEINIINQIIPLPQNIPVKVIDVDNNTWKIYYSMSEAGRALCNDYHITDGENKGLKVVSNYLTGKVKKPTYKGRFRFEYAKDTTR